MLASKTLGCAAAAPPDPAWDISNLVFLQSATLGNFFTQDLFFRPNGLKLYFTFNGIREYDLSTAWNITTASFLQSESASGAKGLFFKPDGTKMYVSAPSSSRVDEYTLSTAWDISTLTFIQSLSISSQTADPVSLFFRSDGIKMYALGRDSQNGLFEYTLSTAWDISTASYVQRLYVGNEPEGMTFKPDGTKTYITRTDTVGDIQQYDLSTPWDISTATLIQTVSVAAQTDRPHGVAFKDDGLKCYIHSRSGVFYEYDLV